MAKAPALFALLMFCVGCGVFELNDSSDIVTGRWASNVAAVAGHCCHLDITLESNDGEVSGSGFVETPGTRVGISEKFTVQVTGSVIDERLSLKMASTNNPGTIEGFVDRNYDRNFDLVLRVNFEGFGFEGRDIILFPRATP